MATLAAANTQPQNNPFATTLIMPISALSGLANSQTRKMKVGFAGTVVAVRYRAGTPTSTASKLATLTSQISGSAITGGVMSLTTATTNAAGGTVAGTSITAANTFTAGQTLEVAVSSVTAFVEGDGWVEFDVTN
jgi:hypothetical protein